MTLKYDREKLVREQLIAIKNQEKKDKDFFKWAILSSLHEIAQRVSALERVLAKKKVLHPREVNTELQKVQKGIIKEYNKLLKEWKKK